MADFEVFAKGVPTSDGAATGRRAPWHEPDAPAAPTQGQPASTAVDRPDDERFRSKRTTVKRRSQARHVVPGVRDLGNCSFRRIFRTKLWPAPFTIARTQFSSLANSVRYPIFPPAPHKSRVRLVLWGFRAALIIAWSNQSAPAAERSQRLFRREHVRSRIGAGRGVEHGG